MKIDSVKESSSIKPSSPTPLQLYNLSFIDEKFLNTYIPLILYYSFNNSKNTTTQSAMSRQLKNSLSDSLVRFYPELGAFRFSSNCRFQFHDADFGWGKPVWVSTGGSCIKNVINLLDSVKPGGVESMEYNGRNRNGEASSEIGIPRLSFILFKMIL